MPVTKSAHKALRGSKRKKIFNAKIRDLYKAALKKARKNPTPALVRSAYQLLDKAAKTNVIHRNKASRLKSRLAKLVSKKAPKETAKKKTGKVAKASSKKTKAEK